MIVVGIGLSLLTFMAVRHRESREMELRFEQDALERHDSLKREIEFDLQTLEAITAFYRASPEVDRSAFRTFVKTLLDRHPGIHALEWIPRLPAAQRKTYEARAKRDGFPGFQITERDARGRMVRAPEREEYFPVYFVEPFKGNETALGFDLASNRTREASLSLARDTGKTTATARVTLVQETANQPGVLVFAPVYRKNALLASVEDRRKNLIGFVLGVFRIGSIMDYALARLSPERTNVSLFDQPAPENDRPLHASPPHANEMSVSSMSNRDDGRHGQFRYVGAIDVADRRWIAVFTPGPLAAKQGWQPWTTLAAGLLLTALLTGYLSITIGRARRVERLVEELTRDLARANADLHSEVIERKDAEESIRRINLQLEAATVQAEKANAAKSIFLANMSHEIRTPISGVLGMTRLLLGTPLTDKQRGHAEKIRRSGTLLLGVINDILDLSKIEAGKLSVERVPFSLAESIGNVADAFGPRAEEKGIALHTFIEPAVPASLLGDPLRLTQVMNNLMGNAVKFTQAGEIRLAIRAVAKKPDHVDLELSVGDTGVGISEEEMARIFLPFTQADESTTRRFGGSGLGLSISRHLCELMGGTLRGESTPGKGSVFTVNLPFGLPPDSEHAPAPTSPERGLPASRFPDARALVVEDGDINMEIAVEMLRGLDIAVDTAQNGREALDRVRTGAYDVVFMDIQMPVMDGYEATREIRRLDKERVLGLPIVAMTAHASGGDREKSLAAGMNDHLTKPIDPEKLAGILEHWLPAEMRAVVPGNQSDGPVNSSAPWLTGQVPGLEVESGLRRVNGNRRLYLTLLEKFVDGYAETGEELLYEVRTGQLEKATRRVHSIKSTSGSIGGRTLEAAAAELEKALRENGGTPSPPGEAVRKFMDAHNGLLSAIAAALPPRQTGDRSQSARQRGLAGEYLQLLAQLKAALVKNEPRPAKEILAVLMRKQWPNNDDSSLAELSRLVQHYRFDEAMELLDSLNESLDGNGKAENDN